MIKNFDEVKRQLKELSEVVNSFKSEAVQLRIVELVFGLSQSEEDDSRTYQEQLTNSPRKQVRKRTSKKTAAKGTSKKTAKRSSGEGAPATLDKLLGEGFFSKARTISDMVEHCDHNLARKFKSNEFSGKLARLVREGTLKRKKNADGQYEYQKP